MSKPKPLKYPVMPFFVTARQKYIIMSPRKLRRVINLVRGQHVIEAMNNLRLMPYDAASVVSKKLREAIANAQVQYGVNASRLVLSAAFVDEGPSYKRFRPRAQGRMYRREKPTAHLTLEVSVIRLASPQSQDKQPIDEFDENMQAFVERLSSEPETGAQTASTEEMANATVSTTEETPPPSKPSKQKKVKIQDSNEEAPN
jgi:large subunit ribosomal protein L22